MDLPALLGVALAEGLLARAFAGLSLGPEDVRGHSREWMLRAGTIREEGRGF